MPSTDTKDLGALVDEWRARVSRMLLERRARRSVTDPRLTVAVIAYRSNPAALRSCLESIQRACAHAGVSIERLVADCGGNEPCRELISELCDTELTLLTDCTLNEARNAVLAWASANLLMLVDDDGILEDDAVAAMLRHFDSSNLVGVRGRIRFKDNRYLTTLGTHYDRGERVVDDLLLVEGHMAMRRDCALRVGGFDEDMFGGEGLVISYRLLRDNPGTRIVYAPDVVMRHDFYHDVRHFVRKSTAFTNQHQMLLERYRNEPGFTEFMDAYQRRRHRGARLTVDEWLVNRGLRLARSAIRLWTRARGPGRARVGGLASPRRD